MKRIGRLISIIMVSMMVLTLPCVSFAAEAEPFDSARNNSIADSVNMVTGDAETGAETAAAEDETGDDGEDAAEAASDDQDTGVKDAADDADADPDEIAEDESLPDEEAAEADLTEVTVVGSVEELSAESEAAGNDAFFTIDVSRKKTSEELATEDIQEDVKDILGSKGSTQGKKNAVADTLERSGYYSTDEGSGSKLKVTSEFANMRLRLEAGETDVINAYGATKAVFYKDYYLLSYDSEEATKNAYDALVAEYGEDAVLIDKPMSLNSSAKGWGTDYMAMDYEQVKAREGSEVTVAVIDSGITSTHEIFKDTEIVDAYDFVNNKAGKAKDDQGHGTAVAGIIAESTPANVKIMPLKTMASDGKGGATGSSADMMMALEYAEEHGADIVNLSMGSYITEKELNYYENIFSEFSMLIICSAGNDKKNMDNPDVHEFPAELENTVCVSAFDQNGKRASYSNYGSSVDFSAPGSNVTLARNDNNKAYSAGNGTSFSSPYISAAAALKMAEYEDLSNDNIVDLLKSVSEDMGASGKDIYYGYGCPVFEKSESKTTGGDLSGATLSDFDSKIAYTGSELVQSPVVIVKGNVLREGIDYEISYSDNIEVGTATMVIRGIGDYSGTLRKSFQVIKAANDLAVKGLSVKVKKAKVKDSALALARSKVIRLSGGQGTISFEKTKGSDNLKIDKNSGAVTIKKATGKGTYKMTVRVSASGDDNYKSASKTVTITVKIK